MLVVTADASLTEAHAHDLHDYIEEWLDHGGPLIVAHEGIHVAAEQPDGSWLRLCHDHNPAVTDDPATVPG